MYALIFWLRSKTTSVVDEKLLCPIKNEGEVTFVKYEENNRLYKAKIIRKSDDAVYLNCLKVNTEGEILVKGKNTKTQVASNTVNNLRRKRKESAEQQTSAISASNKRVRNAKSIFSDTEDEEEDNESEKQAFDHPIDEFIENEENEIEGNEQQDPFERIKQLEELLKNATNAQSEARDPEASTSKVVEIQAGKITSKKISSVVSSKPSSSSQRPAALCDQSLNDLVVRVDENQTGEITSKNISSVGSSKPSSSSQRPAPICDKSMNDLVVHVDEELEENQDPLEECRKAGEGKSKLVSSFHIFIDTAELAFIQRWKKEPKEMCRRLLRTLVGTENLKNMCARGNSKARPSVPEDILRCVEYYVNKRCTSMLSPSEFTNVVNYMCGTLRHGKK